MEEKAVKLLELLKQLNKDQLKIIEDEIKKGEA